MLLVFVKYATRIWNQSPTLCFIATMQSKPSLVGAIASWISILQPKTSLALCPKLWRKGPPLIWTCFSWLHGLFRETETMPYIMMLATPQLKFGRLQSYL